jgi:methionyl-tRNA formyltransferase
MAHKKIVLLGGPGFSTYAVYHAIRRQYPIAAVILENKVPLSTFLKKRAKKLGWFTVAGQVLFQATVVKWLTRGAAQRLQQIEKAGQLEGDPIPESDLIRVNSVNDDAVIAHLQSLQPDLVVVNGTRIIAKRVLQSVACPFINTHAGITPQYRGVHGTYWALASRDAANSGVTVHLVDAGIDTGGVLYQATVTPTPADNFVTYPLLQLGAGIPLLLRAIGDALHGELQPQPREGKGKLWHHPTLWQYLYNRIVHKVK